MSAVSIHRGIAVVAFTIIVATSACDGGSDETRPTPSSSTKATPTPTVRASRDPGAEAVPLAGDDDVTIDWALEQVNGSDPVVDVARRTISLVLLAAGSSSWTHQAKIKKASDALTIDGSVLVEPLSKARVPRGAEPHRIRILVQKPEAVGDRATAWMCLDFDATANPSKSGVLASVTLVVDHGLWKATDYDLNPEITPKVEPRFKRCRASY
jgi:hypothetical protein